MPVIKILSLILIAISVLSPAKAEVKSGQPIDIVFCVDLSGSTNGIVEDFRENYTHILNQLAGLKPKPNVRIGLVGFSRKAFGRSNSYVKILCPLDADLDQPWREFWKLQTSIEMGDQYIAEALDKAVNAMNWTDNPDGIKLIYLVGNGIVSLGTSSYTEACEKAALQNIVINTIYCKPSNMLRELSGWRRIANITSGTQYEIGIGQVSGEFKHELDMTKIIALNKKLNDTYLGYGLSGKDNVELMQLADRSLGRGPDISFLARMCFKISEEFQSSQKSWDLVQWQLAGNDNFKLIDRKSLLKEYRHLTDAELEYVVYNKRVQRQAIIAELKQMLTPELLSSINQFVRSEQTHNEKLEKVIIASLLEISVNKGYTAALSTE